MYDELDFNVVAQIELFIDNDDPHEAINDVPQTENIVRNAICQEVWDRHPVE